VSGAQRKFFLEKSFMSRYFLSGLANTEMPLLEFILEAALQIITFTTITDYGVISFVKYFALHCADLA
jgi:hypothetical protein